MPTEQKKQVKTPLALDAYDRARQHLGLLHMVGGEASISEDAMLRIHCTAAITEAILALVDATYLRQGIARQRK